ncbi:NDR1/HIN1-like protein 1 [Prunus yedoensis var. nudiflora]|uniref:NDR1/HIN1-like protein 1 n=1 Tax=Prunus yedoensis var. nudiflora TaxID=2094558 RepID=A0A314ZQW8_PRUYE|nr:NDR1/HIN1-like protein 1 [Prunus yedoensis var. nudiflora]
MSQALTKSPKHCGNKQGLNIGKLYKKLFLVFSTLSTTILSIILLVWLILHPTKPEFSLKEADIYQLNLSGGHLLNPLFSSLCFPRTQTRKLGFTTTSLKCMLHTRVNKSLFTLLFLPSTRTSRQQCLDSFFVGRDQTAGRLVLNLKVIGRLRWKVGTWVSGKYRVNVDCLAVMAFGPSIPTGPLTSRQGTQCSTTV